MPNETAVPIDDGAARVADAVCERFQELRKRRPHGLSYDELAADAKISVATLRNIRNGRTRARADVLRNLSRALEWPEDYLEAVRRGEPPPLSSAAPREASAELSVIEEKLRRIVAELEHNRNRQLDQRLDHMKADIVRDVDRHMQVRFKALERLIGGPR